MTAPSLIARQLRTTGKAFHSWLRTTPKALQCKPPKLFSKVATIALASSALFGSTAVMLGVAPTVAQEKPRMTYVTQTVNDDVLTQALDALRRDNSVTPLTLTVRTGETLGSLLARLNILDPQAFDYIRSEPILRPLVLPQPGQYINAGVLPDGRLAYLHLYLEGPHAQDSRRIELTRTGELFAATQYAFAFDTLEESISGVATGNFDATAKALDIPDTIVEQMKEVWDGADNPIRTLKKGDALRLIYERKFAGGDFIRNGQLLAVQIVSSGNVHEAYWFNNDDRAGGFYTLEGRASQQTFMRVPLDVQDVSSEFSPLRRHPVTGVIRPHNGTDFRAPSGSRIFAAADGVISYVGYERKGYGRYIKIDHGLGRTTLYAHMSRITKNLKKGQRVHRGDVIGYVGRSGLATGPHLHYELMFDGVQINPRTADLPDTENLSAFQLAQLKTLARPIQARFDLLAESEALPVPTVLKTHLEEEKAVATQLLHHPDDNKKEDTAKVAQHSLPHAP